MNRRIGNLSEVIAFAVRIAILVLASGGQVSAASAFPIFDPVVNPPLATKKGRQVAVFAGGCFWGVQAVFEHVKGVSHVTSGYSGGTIAAPAYEQVSSGETGHAESVKITFDPAQISYEQLLKLFFSVVHDPTQLNRQGPDIGSQYRSVIFYTDDEQKRLAEAYLSQLDRTKLFPRPIVTQVMPLKAFYDAEAYHQDYARFHPDDPYIIFNDEPKIKQLRQLFPDLYKK